MVNYSDQVVAFIGFKVAAMGPFGLVWVIITFMHDLRRQCITRKTWLKFNHFLIYVFMQELTMDGHEWNNAMRLGLVWYPRSVCAGHVMSETGRNSAASDNLCQKCVHLWEQILFVSGTSQMYVYISLQCIKDIFLNYPLTLASYSSVFLYFIVNSTRSYNFKGCSH